MKMIACASCGCTGSPGDFTYLAPAGGTGPATLRRCPACGELIIVDELEEQEESAPSSGPWGSGDMRDRRLTEKDREVEK